MTKPRTIADYNSAITNASTSVLLEVMTILKSYRDSLVLVGGWVPYLLLRDHGGGFGTGPFGVGPFGGFQHAGSIDIDLAIDVEKIDEDAYDSIVELLAARGYTVDPQTQFRMNRSVPGLAAPIGLDFLVERAPEQGKNRRHREVQPGLKARVTPHLDLAFKYSTNTKLEGDLLDGGGKTSLEIRMADLPAFFALKGLALGERYKEKDAYDIYAVTRYYGMGYQEVASKLAPHKDEPGLREGLKNIRERFRSLEAEGPAWVVKFISPTTADEAARLRQDAFMTMSALLEKLT